MRMPMIALLATLTIILAGCASGGTGSPAATEAASGAAPSVDAPAGDGGVTIIDFAFQPTDVRVAAGTTVTWTNTGDATHTVKWSDGTPESEGLPNGTTYERTFDAPGTFDYVCGIHGSMAGTITVTE